MKNCFLGGPRNSSFVLRSKIQTTAPTRRKDIPVTHHINGVNGLKNAQALEFNFQTGATTTSPDSIYGCVKSTIFVLSVVIVMSPTAASKSYIYVTSKPVNQELTKSIKNKSIKNKSISHYKSRIEDFYSNVCRELMYFILTPVVILCRRS